MRTWSAGILALVGAAFLILTPAAPPRLWARGPGDARAARGPGPAREPLPDPAGPVAGRDARGPAGERVADLRAAPAADDRRDASGDPPRAGLGRADRREERRAGDPPRLQHRVNPPRR